MEESSNWVVQNLQNALATWNDKLRVHIMFGVIILAMSKMSVLVAIIGEDLTILFNQKKNMCEIV